MRFSYQSAIGFAAALMLLQSNLAFAQSLKPLPDAEAIEKTEWNVGLRALTLVATHDLRSIELHERSIQRQIGEVERRIRAINAMAEKSGSTYSLRKEFVFAKMDFLLYGCYAYRLLITPNKIRPMPHPLMCLLMDSATAASAVSAVKLSKSAGALRFGAIAVGVLSVTQQALSWSYSDEIKYREKIEELTPAGVEAELQNQFIIAESLAFDLAVTLEARRLLLHASQAVVPRGPPLLE